MPRRTTLALGSLALNKLMALDKADLVLHEGVILGHPASDSIAVAGGKILALGLFDDFKPLVGPRTHLIRLAGRVVAPGLIDSHLHFLEGASAAAGLSLWRCRTARRPDGRVARGRRQDAAGQLDARVRMR